jgi:hydrogenase maturation protease
MADPTNREIAVIGLGNTLRGDDGVAMALLEHLEISDTHDWHCFPLGTFSTLIGQCFRGQKKALIIDAVHTGARPGTLILIDLSPPLSTLTQGRMRTTHGFSFLDEIQIHQQFLPEQIWFLGIESDECGAGEKLSAAMQLRLPQLVQETRKVLTCMAANEPVSFYTS